jgi:hypothetical protein
MAGPSVRAQGGDPAVEMANAINAQLRAQGIAMQIASIEFFTIGQGRPSARILQQPFRWVPNDPRRIADGDNLTYVVDQSGGATASGLTNAQTEAAIDAAFGVWSAEQCLRNVALIKRADGGGDYTIYDFFYGFGGFGDYLYADIVNAGWYPRAYFEAVGGPGGGRGILAFSVTFVWTDDDGNPVDANNDGYLDTALNEVYYNNTFGQAGTDRVGNPWVINGPLPGIDVQTVAFHENGHSLGVGHFGPPPTAVMNPVYGGVRHSPYATDHAGMCTIYSKWPHR